MLKKTITYTDYEGNERTEDFYFNLSKAEALEMQLGKAGGLARALEMIVATRDQPKIVEYFKEFILKSYGEKSPDGKRFIKSPEIVIAFSETEAFSMLFMELATNADAAAVFVEEVLPKQLEDHLPPQKKGAKAEVSV